MPKQYESAIETYKKGYQIDSTSYIGITALYEIAYSYAALEDYEKANIFIDNYIDKISLADESIDVYNKKHSALKGYLLKATILFDNERHDETGELYKKILTEIINKEDENDIPYLAAIYYNLGLCYIHKSEYEEAKKCFFNSLYYNPLHNKSNLLLAYTYEKNDQYTMAAAIYFYFISLDPKSEDIPEIIESIKSSIMNGYQENGYGEKMFKIKENSDPKEFARLERIKKITYKYPWFNSEKEALQIYMMEILDLLITDYKKEKDHNIIDNYYLNKFVSINETADLETMYNHATQNVYKQSSKWLKKNKKKKEKIERWFNSQNGDLFR